VNSGLVPLDLTLQRVVDKIIGVTDVEDNSAVDGEQNGVLEKQVNGFSLVPIDWPSHTAAEIIIGSTTLAEFVMRKRSRSRATARLIVTNGALTVNSGALSAAGASSLAAAPCSSVGDPSSSKVGPSKELIRLEKSDEMERTVDVEQNGVSENQVNGGLVPLDLTLQRVVDKIIGVTDVEDNSAVDGEQNGVLEKQKVTKEDCLNTQVVKLKSNLINTAEALRYFKATDNLRQTFEEYMNDGMTMTEAICVMTMMNCSAEDFVNTRLNPTNKTVQNWHEKWRSTHLTLVLVKVISPLENLKKHIMNMEYLFLFKMFLLHLLTSFMLRAHDLPLAKDIVFVDSTSFCDPENPINIFDGKSFPTIFLTDNSYAEINALKAVWPNSKPLFSSNSNKKSSTESMQIVKEHNPNLEKQDCLFISDDITQKLSNNIIKYGESTYENLLKFKKRLDKIHTAGQFNTFLATAGTSSLSLRHRDGASIKVQPTTIARRRPGITRGSKHLLAGKIKMQDTNITITILTIASFTLGRLAGLSDSNRPKKKPINLLHNIKNCVTNAKSHK
ncbi:SWIM-type domain-containing protein, partial [Aphis craccivora]